MGEKLYDYNAIASLESAEAIAVFLADALETADAVYISKAMGAVARAKGMAELASETGLSREQLDYLFNGEAKLTLKTMLLFMRAFGVDLTARSRYEEPETASEV